MRPIVWLASYPKCGNTWLRMLLTNLTRSEAIAINDLGQDGGTASGRARFDDNFLFAAGLLHPEECDRLRPALYRHMALRDDTPDGGDATDSPGLAGLARLRFIKTHDAWTLNDRGEPVLGGREAACAAILIVRDPRDVAASLANHNGQSIDEAIELMARPDSALAAARDRQPLQLRQILLGWSGFCRSWLDQQELPVHLLRYEDMQSDASAALGGTLAALGVNADPALLDRAAARSDFGILRAQEAAGGFREAPVGMATGRFFRSGRSGGWREELNDAQRRRIEADHAEMMRRCGYRPEAG